MNGRKAERRLPAWRCRAMLACALGITAATSSWSGTDPQRPPLNLFEWMATAPIVIAGEVSAPDRKLVAVAVTSVVRGNLDEGRTILVDQGLANRERLDGASTLKMEEGETYLLLLGPPDVERHRSGPVYPLVRDVDGARRLPAEGREAWIEAAFRLGRIQAVKDDDLLWREMGDLLASRNPLVSSTALDLHLKFGRGDARLLAEVRRLMLDSRPDVRRRATQLAGQILSRSGWRQTPGDEGVLDEILARARRDQVSAVRVTAVRALTALEGPEIDEALRQISKDDPEQDVRYEAERALLDRPGSRADGTPDGGGD